MNEDISHVNSEEYTQSDRNPKVVKRRKIRRSRRKKKHREIINLVYSNIQGITKKKESLVHIMEELECDICLLAETLTKTVNIENCRCFTPIKSIGQNVCILMRNKLLHNKAIKLYEPNEIINLMGIRIEMLNCGVRVFTAHLKQQSTTSQEDVAAQFEEIRIQFQDANKCNEGMIIIFDSNVHVGKTVVLGSTEDQDRGGKILMKMISEENLVLLNAMDLCSGVITRVDPRNGNGSTLDLAICNQFMCDNICEMKIDEDQNFIPTNYASTIKKTDHNTIVVKMVVDKIPKAKPSTYVNTRDNEGRESFKNFIELSNIDEYVDNSPERDVQYEFEVMSELWDEAIKSSFKRITPKKTSSRGINPHVRELMKEERWVRMSVVENPDRGRMIAEIRSKIRTEIGKNRAEAMWEKVSMIKDAKNPQGEVFKIRRQRNKVEKVGFPLKDTKGNIQVSKEGIDRVVVNHFERVFRQNPVPKGKIWEQYWKLIDEVFELLESQIPESDDYCLPSFEEIKKLLMKTDDKKSVLGTMTSDLVKLSGESMIKMIHRFVVRCCQHDKIPEGMREEKLVILYKNKGQLTDIDNYRGIFIRLLCISLIQKWLFLKCSPTVDHHGSELAFGGRKGRCVAEVLLIVRLIQDYCHWSKQPLILKFLDITKFFDSMNYKKCLIEAFKSGIKGKYWKLYKCINERKRCTPYTPLGECPSLDVDEVFLQGSCDAMIMAWNLVDSINKYEDDVYDPVVVIDGVQVPRMLFVDDILEIMKTNEDLKVTVCGNETFEKTNRIEYKPSKCKLIYSNCVPSEEIKMNDSVLQVVSEHEYLGSIISVKGRKSDLAKRIIDCKGVINEIVEVLKTEGVGEVRLQFMKTLIRSCFIKKFEHGCEVWDSLSAQEKVTINKLIPNMVKRIFETPGSTPTAAVTHDTGIIDLDLEVAMERVLLASKVMQMDDNRISRKLLTSMIRKKVPGFCTTLADDMEKIGIDNLEMLKAMADERKIVKDMLVEVQRRRLVEDMTKGSKTDAMLLNFSFDGKMKEYLMQLTFPEARIIFLFRSRMFPTKSNFPKRWSKSKLCTFCCEVETDEHLLMCCGYMDIHRCVWRHDTFMKLECDIEYLSAGAKVLIGIHDRLLQINEDNDVKV